MSELLGLRGRLAAALVAISALSLVIATVLLLFPLNRKLEQDGLDSLTTSTRAARAELASIPAGQLQAASPALARVTSEIRRDADAEVFVFDDSAKLLISTDLDAARDRFPEAERALRDDELRSVLTHDRNGTHAHVAVPATAGGRHVVLELRRSLADINGIHDVVERSFAAAAFVALAVALVAGIALATRLVRRLTALRDSALRMAELGPGASAPVDDGRRDEVGDLARAFVTMQGRLEAQEQARRTFVSTASHELRTPLTSLRLMLHGAGDALAGPHPDLPEAQDQVDRALGQTVRLGKLAEELLDLSRIDAGVELRAEPVELADLARSVVAEFRAPVELSATAPVWVLADPGAVARILRIVLDNALRHAGPDGRVELRVDASGPAVEIADSGPGIAAGEEDRIFERFQRGRDGAGFGLGLAIGRELARQMGGELELITGDGGARFRARFVAAAERA